MSSVNHQLQPNTVDDFRNILSSETQNLNQLCERWDKVLKESHEEDEDQDLLGSIRSTIGQAKLLISQRFKQFTDLINQCEFNTGQMPTTLNDLSGFWEMISFQVTDVLYKFKALEEQHEK